MVDGRRSDAVAHPHIDIAIGGIVVTIPDILILDAAQNGLVGDRKASP